MEFDYSQVVVPPGGVYSYPSFPYESHPVTPLKDSASVQGNASTRGGIIGSATTGTSLQ